jgi:hypothetical protein
MNKYDFNPFDNQKCIDAFLDEYADDFYEFADRWFEEQVEATEEFKRELNEDR